MRILHTSDWHLGKSLEQINRINEQREFIDCLCSMAEEQKIDLVLIAGDIYDTYNPSAAAEELFYEAIDRLNGKGRRAVVVIAGNHDNPERLCAASVLTYKNGIILLGYPSSDAGDYWPRGESADRGSVSDAGESADRGFVSDAVESADRGSANAAGESADRGSVNAAGESVSDSSAKATGELAGNDSSNTAGAYKYSANGIRIADSGPGWLELGVPGCDYNAVILTMPYPSEARLEEVLSQEADEGVLQKAYSDRIGSIFSTLGAKFRDDTVNLIVAHMFMLGGSTSDSERTLQVGGAMTVNPGIMPEKTHFAALGHLHRPQEIRNAACPVFYAGSPLAYSFSEADYSKAVYIVNAVPGVKAVVTPVYLDCGKPLKKWVAEDGIGQAIKWCKDGRDKNAWIDLEIVTDRVLTSDEQKNLRSLHPGIVNIRPRLRTDEVEFFTSQSREGRKIDELFSDYYRYRMGVEIPEDLMEAFIEILNDENVGNEENEDNEENEGNEENDGNGENGENGANGKTDVSLTNPMANAMNGEVTADETEAS